MNGTITESRLATIMELGIALAETDLRRDDSVVVGVFKLDLGQTLRVGWLALQLLKINLAQATPTKVNSSLGFVYLGIYAGGFEPLRRPSGTPINFVNLSGPNTKLMNPYPMRAFSGPDVIHVLVVNNTLDTDVEVMVSGSLKLYTSG